MSKIKKFILSLVVLLTITGMVGGMLIPVPARAASIQPELKQLALEMPDKVISVIAQKADTSQRAEKLVGRLGGVVTNDLHIINAFAAQLSAQSAVKLSQSTAVRWVSLDGAVERSGKPVKSTAIFTVRDDFDIISFYNNDGTAGWKTPWQENDVSGPGPGSGNVFIDGSVVFDNVAMAYGGEVGDGELILQDYPDTGTEPSITRSIDFSDGVSSAMLSYYFRFGPNTVVGEDAVAFEISNDGGLTYRIVSTLSFNGGTTGSAYRNILADASPDTRFRFRVVSGFDAEGEYFALDYLQVEYEGNAFPRNTFIETLRVDDVWEMGYDGAGIGVAVIDSGMTKEWDFGQRVEVQKSFNPVSNTVLDVNGHGTYVAGIIGSNGSGSDGIYYGVAPGVNLLSLKVSDDTGMAYESDVVEAIQWVFDNKDTYNIRVVNLSINSSVESSYHTSPMSVAVEILWFNGVVVVSSAGNYWSGDEFNPVLAAPANDPFVITVGATDEKGTTRTRDDVVANFSAFGTTLDGHFKPDIYAPGKDIISILSSHSDWDEIAPDRVVGGKYFRISGTSSAAPMVTGVVALMLQADPTLTPDQVKYRLVNTADWIGPSKYVNAYEAVTGTTTENANTGLTASQLLWSGDDPVAWDSVSWNSVSWNSVSWNSVAWNSVSWNSVAWNSVSWND